MCWSTPASRLALAGILIVLSALSRAAEIAETPADPTRSAPPAGYVIALLEVTINRQPQEEPIVVLRDDKGRVHVAASDLSKWRLRIPSVKAIEYASERYIPLDELSGLVVDVDEVAQSMKLTAPAALFAGTALDAQPRAGPVPQRTATGGFVNYTLVGSHADSSTTTAGSFELGAFGRFGTANATGIVVHSNAETRFTRLDTTWTYAMPERLSTIRAGDTISRAGTWGNALRFGGVQFATDFATQPNLVLTPGQFASGQATVPSTVDVYINNALVSRQAVKPGPFSITNIPPITGSGNVTLIVRDELGREQVITRPFYASQSLLRPGLDDYSFDLGFLRENYGSESFDYGSAVASATYRRGLSDRVTAEVRGEALGGLANAGMGVSILVGELGILSTSVAGGHNRKGNGGRVSIGFERQSRGLSFAFAGTWRSPKFRLAGETDVIAVSPALPIPRHEWLATADYSFGRYGSVAFTYVSRAYLNQPTTTVAALGYSLSLERYGYVGFSVSRVGAIERTTTINALWTVPLGATTSASLGFDRTRGSKGVDGSSGTGNHDGRTLTVQRNLPVGEGFGYRLYVDNDDARRGQIDYQNRIGTYSVEVAQLNGKTGERLSASGGLGMISGNFFLSRTISDSFGLVRLPGYPGVRVYAENREIGRTNAAGELIVPRLLPYLRNALRIEQSDLPLDAEFEVLDRAAVPFARSGVVVDFDVKPSRGAVVTIVQGDGAAVPSGAQVRVEGQERAAPVALDGAAYLTGLVARNRVSVTWQDNACTFEFDYPATRDPQPSIGPFVCR